MKKKILIYIDSDLYVRNYFTYNSLDLSDFETSVYANGSVSHKHILQSLKNFKGYLFNSINRSKLRNIQFDINMTRYRKKSKSFSFRLSRQGNRKKLFYKTISLPLISEMILFFVKNFLGENQQIKQILEKEKPDLVLVPSQIVLPIQIDLIESCNKMSIKTLFLIDGWDNISSKTIFPVFPTYLAVWGQQSIDHAVTIQAFPRERVFAIGTPRFESYTTKTRKHERIYEFKYALFTGCAIPFDEISALRILDHCVTKNGISDFKIVYRPHPWRQKRSCFDYFIQQDFKNVIMDEQMIEYYNCRNIYPTAYESALQPALDYYPIILGQSMFVISPLTTMIIEAAIMNKKVLVLAYDDGCHLTNPQNALRNYEHFVGIENISAFNFCYDYSKLCETFLSLLSNVKQNQNESNVKDEFKYIIEVDTEKYSDKLNRIIHTILD